MVSRMFLAVGTAALAGGLLLGAVFLYHAESARRGDQPPTQVTSAGDCPDTRLEVSLPRMMSEGESAALEVALTSPGPARCTWDVWVVAASALDVSPATSQTVRLSPGQSTGTAHWFLTPKRPGAWDVRVIAGGLSETRRIKVTTILGLPPFMAALLSPTLLVLGPMVTLPYWLERWRARKAAPARG